MGGVLPTAFSGGWPCGHGVAKGSSRSSQSGYPMTAKLFSVALVALLAAAPLSGAMAETAASAPQKAGIFALLAPKDPAVIAAKAERKAARQAEREAARAAKQDEKARAKASGSAQSASTADVARAEVKAAVADARANRPKGRLWCVPFARAVTGVEIRGNAKTWWDQAKGRYARGAEPQVGAVMAFAASRSMPKGHVAVVSQVVSEREILIDQANWERNQITVDTLVVDVSDRGDWSRVKVANGGGTLGRVNPVSGFIYN